MPDCDSELEDLAKILNVRVVDITQTPLKKSIPIKLSSQKIIELINKTGYNLEQDSSGDASFTMELSDSQYKVLSHAKTVYPENRVGRSLILKMHRVLNILRDIKADNSVLIPSWSSDKNSNYKQDSSSVKLYLSIYEVKLVALKIAIKYIEVLK